MLKKIFERFFENILSVKVWCIFISTILICFGFLSGTEYTIIITGILGIREVFKVSKIKWENSDKKIPI